MLAATMQQWRAAAAWLALASCSASADLYVWIVHAPAPPPCGRGGVRSHRYRGGADTPLGPMRACAGTMASRGTTHRCGTTQTSPWAPQTPAESGQSASSQTQLHTRQARARGCGCRRRPPTHMRAPVGFQVPEEPQPGGGRAVLGRRHGPPHDHGRHALQVEPRRVRRGEDGGGPPRNYYEQPARRLRAKDASTVYTRVKPRHLSVPTPLRAAPWWHWMAAAGGVSPYPRSLHGVRSCARSCRHVCARARVCVCVCARVCVCAFV